jgi:Protein of unknown function (DUF1153)
MTIADRTAPDGPDPFPLPEPGTTHWVAQRKAEIVDAVEARVLSVEEAVARYGLSFEEFASWRRALCRGGLHALETTHRPPRRARRAGRRGP